MSELSHELTNFLLPYFLVDRFPLYFYGPGIMEVKITLSEVRLREIQFSPWKKDELVNPFERVDPELRTRTSDHPWSMWINLLDMRFSESRFGCKWRGELLVITFNGRRELQNILNGLAFQHFYCRYPRTGWQLQFDVVGDKNLIVVSETILHKFSPYGEFYLSPVRE